MRRIHRPIPAKWRVEARAEGLWSPARHPSRINVGNDNEACEKEASNERQAGRDVSPTSGEVIVPGSRLWAVERPDEHDSGEDVGLCGLHQGAGGRQKHTGVEGAWLRVAAAIDLST